MRPKYIFLYFLLMLAICCQGQIAGEPALLNDNETEKRLIPVKLLGWTGVFEMHKMENLTESGIIIYHIRLDKDGNISDILLKSSNISAALELIYRKNLKATWEPIAYHGEGVSEAIEGDYALHISAFK